MVLARCAFESLISDSCRHQDFDRETPSIIVIFVHALRLIAVHCIALTYLAITPRTTPPLHITTPALLAIRGPSEVRYALQSRSKCPRIAYRVLLPPFLLGL